MRGSVEREPVVVGQLGRVLGAQQDPVWSRPEPPQPGAGRRVVTDIAEHGGLPSTGGPGPVDYAAASKAANTWRAYRTDWPQWIAWCTLHDVDPWQADPHVAAWVSDVAAAYKPSSIGRKVAPIAALCKMAGAATADP